MQTMSCPLSEFINFDRDDEQLVEASLKSGTHIMNSLIGDTFILSLIFYDIRT